jgi:hypothetical protein
MMQGTLPGSRSASMSDIETPEEARAEEFAEQTNVYELMRTPEREWPDAERTNQR